MAEPTETDLDIDKAKKRGSQVTTVNEFLETYKFNANQLRRSEN